MKYTFVIGNGFDLDAGLKTSYKSFTRSGFWPFSHSTEVHGQETLASYLRKKSELNTKQLSAYMAYNQVTNRVDSGYNYFKS